MKKFNEFTEAYAGQAVNSADKKTIKATGPDGKTYFKQIPAKRNLTQEQAEYDEYVEMTRSELKIAINSAKKILDMMDDDVEIERWQISEIVTASDSLATVYQNLLADNMDEEDDEEDEYDSEEDYA